MNWRVTAIVVLTAAAACASSESPAEPAAQTAGLPMINTFAALGAPSCDADMLADAEFGIFAREPEKLVALDRSSRTVLCVDAFEAIETMLQNEPERADRLWLRYEASLQDVGASLSDYW